MDWVLAIDKIKMGLSRKHLVTIFGSCEVDYVGRATSKLSKGKRLVLIKGDNSISIHQNRLVRPTNYMMNTSITIESTKQGAVLTAKRLNPREIITVMFDKIDDVQSYEMEISDDLRLSGSERDLNDILMEDLSMIEPGLKPINQQEHFRKGIADIIAEDKHGHLVVIELKRRQADYASVTQLQRYMQEVQSIKNCKARGILLAPSIRKNALELLEKNGLEFAKIDFELKPSSKEKAHIKGLQKKQQTLDKF
ncbi:MAG: endonuclease NucS [Candidatus ainarchaeum sp.]|nr:endonuclease NucS [Candidatus ainarchaeum sp.]